MNIAKNYGIANVLELKTPLIPWSGILPPYET